MVIVYQFLEILKNFQQGFSVLGITADVSFGFVDRLPVVVNAYTFLETFHVFWRIFSTYNLTMICEILWMLIPIVEDFIANLLIGWCSFTSWLP